MPDNLIGFFVILINCKKGAVSFFGYIYTYSRNMPKLHMRKNDEIQVFIEIGSLVVLTLGKG